MILNFKKILILIVSSLPDKILEKLEKLFSISRGKGYNFSLESEFKNFLKFKKKIRVFVDIGAHKGEYTDQIIKNFPDSKGFIFEPDDQKYLILKTRYKSKNIIVVDKALSNTSGTKFLYSNKKSSGCSSLFKREMSHFNMKFEKTQEVKTIKMLDYFKENIKDIVDFCKIDIEGNELNCLNGFEESIKNFRYIQFEFNACNISSRTFFQDFWYFFKKNNFKIYRLTPSGPLELDRYSEEDEFFGMNNFIAENLNL